MKTLMLFALLAASAWAQLVTVSGSVVDPTGTSVVGVVNIAWPTFMYSGIPITAGSKDFRPVSGTLTAIVYPGNYTVTYRMQNGQTVTMYWHVPNDGVTTRTIAAVQTTFPNPPTNYPLPVGLGGSGNASLTPSRCIQMNSAGTAFESAAAACGSGGGGGGSLSSVGLVLPAIFSVSGSPLTADGNITATLVSQNAGLVLAGPPFGAAAAPTFRNLTGTDMPVGGFAIALQSYTVSGLPAAPATGTIVVATDALASGNCTTGGGSARALCRYTGSAWEAVGDGGSAGALLAVNNLNDVANVSTARGNLGLGDAATKNTGTTAGTVAAGDHAHAASAVTNTPSGNIAGTNVAAALAELDTEKQPLDADLTAIAALACVDGQGPGKVSGSWACVASAGANPSFAFSSVTSATLLGSTHGLGTPNLLVQCFTNATPRQEIDYNTLTIHPSTYDITVTFTNSQTGICHVNGSGGGGGGGGGGASTAITTLYALGSSGSAKTVDPANGWTQTMTLSANCTVTLTQPTSGEAATVRVGVTQAASGGPYTVTFTGAKWPGGIVPIMSSGASKIDWFSCLLDGTNSYCTVAPDFQ